MLNVLETIQRCMNIQMPYWAVIPIISAVNHVK